VSLWLLVTDLRFAEQKLAVESMYLAAWEIDMVKAQLEEHNYSSFITLQSLQLQYDLK